MVKVWPQPRTELQNRADLEVASNSASASKVVYATGRVSRNFMPYLIAACDLYAGPSRLEGFGMPHVEANACAKPVLAVNAHGLPGYHGAWGNGLPRRGGARDLHLGDRTRRRRRENAPASISSLRRRASPIIAPAWRISPRGCGACSAIRGLANGMGEAGRQRVTAVFDYRVVARQFVDIVSRRVPELSRTGRPGVGTGVMPVS